MKLLRLLVALLIVIPPAGAAANAQSLVPPQSGRIALVIGVGNYDSAPALYASVNDARLVSAALQRVGFGSPQLVIDPTVVELNRAIDSFLARAAGLSSEGRVVTAVVYFAGHGAVFDRETYLIPRDFPAATGGMRELARTRAVNAQILVDRLAATEIQRLLVVLDACRTNPWMAGAPSLSVELAPRHGTQQEGAVWFSASRGQVAEDRVGSALNSPFALSFARELVNPNHRTLSDVALAIERLVSELTQRRQRPTSNGQIGFKMTETDEGLERLARQAQMVAPASQMLASAAQTTTQVSGMITGPTSRAPVIEWVRPYRGEPCRDPPAYADPLGLHDRYVELFGRDRLLERARAGAACEQWLLGIGFTRSGNEDRAQAAEWLERAAAQGQDRAIASLTFVYGASQMGPPDLERLRHWYAEGLRRRVGGAIANLAVDYRDGLNGYPQQPDLAIRYFREAVALGNPPAARQLASIYREGRLVPRNMAEALRYYEQAMNMGEFGAATEIATILFYGEGGVTPEPDRAIRLLNEAAGQGDVYAIKDLALRYERGIGVQVDLARALRLYERAADEGDVESMDQVGIRYRLGTGTAIDLARAETWLSRAGRSGSLVALQQLIGLYVAQGGRANLQRGLDLADRILRFQGSEGASRIWPMVLVGAGQWIQRIASMPDAPPVNAATLEALARNFGRPGPGRLKRFSVPITCGVAPSTFDIYIFDWERVEPPTTAQFDWLQAERSCTVAPAVRDSFNRLWEIALENNVSFTDLTVYALGAAQQEQRNPQEQQNRQSAVPRT